MTVYYKMRQMLLQNATAILLQNMTKCVKFFITKCDSFIAKCDSYYKMRRLLELRQYRVHNFRSSLTEYFFHRESFFNRAVCLDLLFLSLLVKRKALELLVSLPSSSPQLSRIMGYFE